MARKLYKVKIEVDLMVMADDNNQAIAIGKKNAPNEVVEYGTGEATIVKSLSNVPDSWKNVIPYGAEGTVQNKTCEDMFQGESTDNMTEEELKHILELNKVSKKVIEGKEQSAVLPETRPDPKPSRELDWQETQSGRPLPHLRFNVPPKKR